MGLRSFLLVSILTLTAVVPGAIATDPLCSTVTDDPIGVAGVYLLGTSIWLEQNNAPGLQRQSCIRDSDNVDVAKDAFVITLLP